MKLFLNNIFKKRTVNNNFFSEIQVKIEKTDLT